MGVTDLCCCCGKELTDPKEHSYVNFRFQIPCTDSLEQVLVAVVCPQCATDSDNPKMFPIIEALINAKIIRIEKPDLLFTPKDRKDEM